MYVRAAVYAVRWNVRVASSGSTVRSCPSIPPTRAFTATRRLNWAALARSPRVTGRLIARCRVGSGKGQDELLQRLGVHRVGSVRVGQALLETAGDDGEAGPVEGAVDGGELGHDVLAVAALLDHPQHAAELALGAAQTVEDRGHLVRVELDHRCSSGPSCRGVGCGSSGQPRASPGWGPALGCNIPVGVSTRRAAVVILPSCDIPHGVCHSRPVPSWGMVRFTTGVGDAEIP